MGNCQAVEVAAALVQHPGGGKVERFYSPVSAHEVMTSNPGHYVALVAVGSPSPGSDSGRTAAVGQQLKLLRPDDSLVLGHVYCLISFEDVLKEFAAKNHAKLGKMVKQSGGLGGGYDHTKKNKKNKDSGCSDPNPPNAKALNFSPVQLVEPAVVRAGDSSSRTSMRGRGGSLRNEWRQHGGALGVGQWRPVLQSISEIGT